MSEWIDEFPKVSFTNATNEEEKRLRELFNIMVDEIMLSSIPPPLYIANKTGDMPYPTI